MQITQITVDHQNKETIQHGSIRFPMQVYLDDLEKYDLGYIRWHWHNEIEFAVVLEGEVEIRADETTLILQAGDGIFINSEVLHTIKSTSSNNAILFTIVMNPQLIANDEHGLIFDSFVQPLVTCKAIPYIQLNSDTAWQQECLQLLTDIYEQDQQMNYGYELFMYSSICKIWYLLIIDSEHTINSTRNHQLTINQQRIKQMLKFMHAHYHEPIQLSDISAVVSISKSECNRCFQKMIGMTPFDYLKQIRLEQAIKLLQNTNLSMSDISSACGFNTLSYFGKLFKQYKGISPKKFRDTKH